MNKMSEVSSEEFFTEDMGAANWANEPEQPTGRCEDAPCCGCCPASSDFELDANNDDHWTTWNWNV